LICYSKGGLLETTVAIVHSVLNIPLVEGMSR
jgi:hypothetical protein